MYFMVETEDGLKMGVALNWKSLNLERRAEAAATVVRLRAVVIHEDTAKATIAKNSAAKFSNVSRRFQPSRRFRVKIPKFLQLLILLFRQKLNAHGRSQIHGTVFRFMFFPGIQ